MSLQTNAERASVSGAQEETAASLAPASKRHKVDAQIATSSSEPTKSLSGIPNLPFDISFEMFSNLAPQYLLTMSRTTEAFRQLLFDRRLATVWKAARQRTFPDAPECPEDVSEPFSTRDMRQSRTLCGLHVRRTQGQGRLLRRCRL
ncbi:hypothetical protein K466DRAFT_336733 [Polyporus arcularius HHB13444]|uniref:F-box domain-containing protein n=1 Tax=Polyporus arcularius HHB13444 TaxID=1314778 RepID=A0A5C3NXI3_9APHY|nr:hypothetical protein K466DRAFT_336733 [Polyporus arcularius HHB13444]